MQPQFLCCHHRQFFSANPCLARHHWDRCMREGRQLMGQRQYQDALSRLGCSFDIAMVLLANHCRPVEIAEGGLTDVERLVDAGQALAGCYRRMGLVQEERNYLLTTHYGVIEAGDYLGGEDSTIYRVALARTLAGVEGRPQSVANMVPDELDRRHSRLMH
jgi:hypothetical protein